MRYNTVKISISDRKDKKYKALFTNDKGETKTIHFGAKGYSDYTKHKDDERKKRYIKRHQENEDFNDPYTAGALARWILWNKKTLSASVEDYKKKFKFK
jgi:hypothetical protein